MPSPDVSRARKDGFAGTVAVGFLCTSVLLALSGGLWFFLVHRAQPDSTPAHVERLTDENSSLRLRLNSLDRVVAEKDRELLDLELELLALRTRANASQQGSTVYNFVNVPVGGAADMRDESSMEYLETSDTVESPEAAQERLAIEWELERAQYNDQGEEVYDPETGFFVRRNYDGDMQDKVYDPETGFYVDKNN